MQEVCTKAPGVVKLLGEHAVVYGKLSLAVAISAYASVCVKKGKEKTTVLDLEDTGKTYVLREDRLKEIYKSFMSRKSVQKFYEENKAYGDLPFLTVLAVACAEYGVCGIEVKVHSEIPMQKGFASSAAISTALATSLLNGLDDDKGIVETARIGEIVMHKSEGAGRIDVNTSYFGGYVQYSQKDGARKLDIDSNLELLAIDTGPKKSTAETVGHVAYLYEKEREKTEKILDRIDECTKNGIKALQEGNIKALGEQMYMDHSYLASLGVSSEGLDKAVEAARKYGAYGAKLSGGGGGGMAIALYKNGLEKEIEKLKFKCMKLEIAKKGAKENIMALQQ